MSVVFAKLLGVLVELWLVEDENIFAHWFTYLTIVSWLFFMIIWLVLPFAGEAFSVLRRFSFFRGGLRLPLVQQTQTQCCAVGQLGEGREKSAVEGTGR